MTTTNDLAERIAARIHREGPISFADFQAMALYDETDGFFATGGGAGRGGRDFVTSPEVGSLFGALVARHLDGVWHDLGDPDPFVVIEAGAGRGRLALDVLRADPACAPALRYVLVERSAELRVEQREHLTIEPPGEALGPFARAEGEEETLDVVAGTGPIVTAIEDLPALHVDGVVLANELLDNLPVEVVERADHGWNEVRVGVSTDGFEEVVVAAPPELSADADHLVGGHDVRPGARLPVPRETRRWLERVSSLLRRGELLVIDYADSVAGLIARGPSSWLRTYAAHDRGASPLEYPGRQDITCDVPLEHLHDVATRVGFVVAGESTQAEWLRTLGIDELVAAGAQTWSERAAIGDLEAIAGRSRGVEAAALCDASGLGAHKVFMLERRIA